MSPHSDLVQEARLETSIFPDYTQHTFYRRGISGSRGRIKTVEQWKRRKYLGNGAYGTVWLESCDRPASQDGPKCRAVKEIPNRISKSNDVDYSRELEAVTKFSQHRYTPFFVQSYGWFETPEAVYITMEYMEKGDLENYLKHPIAEEEAKTIAFQLVQGLQYMHSNGFTHRDLKPKNILVVVTGPDWLVQISDFGISRRLRPDQLTLGTISRGTLGFVAPEMLGLVKERDYPHAIDIWSLGAVIFRMVTKKVFFGEYIPLMEYVAGRRSLPTGDLDAFGATPCLKDLLGYLLAPSPKTRPPATSIPNHEWFRIILEAEETDSDGDDEAVDEPDFHTQKLILHDLEYESDGSEDPSARWTTDVMPDEVAASVRTNPSHSSTKSAMEVGGFRTIIPYKGVEGTGRGDDELYTVGGESTIRPWVRSSPLISGVILMDASQRSSMSITLQGDYDRDTFKFAFQDDNNTIRVKHINERTNIEADSAEGWTLLNWAAYRGYLEDVKILLDMGADITAGTDLGRVALHSASEQGHVEVVSLLLERGADIEAHDVHGFTPLFVASNEGRLEVVRLLLHGSKVDGHRGSGSPTPLRIAARKGHVEVVKLLLRVGADVEARSGKITPLYEASGNGHTEVVKLLISAGADINARNLGTTPLYEASGNGHSEVARLLLSAGADVKAVSERTTPLHEASKRGRTGVVRLFLEAGADVKARSLGDTPLYTASFRGYSEVVKLLLSAGADIEEKSGGSTPLYTAASSGFDKVVELLLEAEADTEASCSGGNTALIQASKHGHSDVVRLLLEAGADIDAVDYSGGTALLQASKGGYPKVVRLLLREEADKEVSDCDGYTALHWASASGHGTVVRLLLEAGACARPKNRAGKTPHDLAMYRHDYRYVVRDVERVRLPR